MRHNATNILGVIQAHNWGNSLHIIIWTRTKFEFLIMFRGKYEVLGSMIPFNVESY